MANPSSEARDRTLLVTGGAGFLGSRTVAHLRSRGYRIAVLDDGSGVPSRRLDQFERDPAISVYRVDLRQPAVVAAVCEAERPSAVVHLAGRHFIPFCDTRPEETWQVNVEGTRNLLAALASRPPRCLLFASTGDVYRESSAPHGEDDPLGSPTVYGRSKLAAERLLRNATSRWATRVIVLRLFNLYGPYPTVEHLIPAIVNQAAAGDRLELGDLTTLRDFVYVDDAVIALAELLAGRESGTYNIGTGTARSGADVVVAVSQLLGRELTTVLSPQRLRRRNRATLIADPTKLGALLPRWPWTSLEEGLRRVLEAHSIPESSPDGPAATVAPRR